MILAVLLLLSAFFSSSETALTTVNKIRMQNMAETGDRRARRVLKVLERPDTMLSAILIGNNIVNLYASALSTLIAADLFGSRSVGAATGLLTLMVLVFGEISPKTGASLYADQVSLRVAGIIGGLMVVLTPVIWAVNHLAFLVLRLLRINLHRKGDTITEDELRTMVAVSEQEGEIEAGEKAMINNVFDFGDAVARDVMIPRVDMTMINVESGLDEVMEIFRREKYTRFPVYRDMPDQVVGILNIKDIFLREETEPFVLEKCLRKPAVTFEQKKIAELMPEMRKAGTGMVLVLDEYGVTVGMITQEDLLEEIVGELHDEYDTEDEDGLRRVGVREYLAEGSLSLDDLDDRLGLNLQSEDYDSIGGLMIGILDHLPAEGETVVVDQVRLRAEKVDQNRIEQVRVTVLPSCATNGSML